MKKKNEKRKKVINSEVIPVDPKNVYWIYIYAMFVKIF